jgi:predicted TIM-barrel fold metal-dependent hydrolase
LQEQLAAAKIAQNLAHTGNPMSVYVLQKLIRDVNRKPACREAYFQSPQTFAAGYELTPAEREALLKFDVKALYEMGVHGLLLRPFTIMHKMSDPDYIKAVRGE